jgi:DNA-binding NarL/FixJ family response regulator
LPTARCVSSSRAERSRSSVRCLIGDDHPAIVEAVARYLRVNGVDVVGQASTGVDAKKKIEAMRPEVAILDVRMPHGGAIELAAGLARSAPETGIIAYSGYGDRALLTDALDAGVRGFVSKDAPLPDLLRAIEHVSRGELYIEPTLAGHFTQGASDDSPKLTVREREVLRLLAQGESNEEIGKVLFLSPETVRTHVRKACVKLGARTRTEAVAAALRRSLIA